MEIHVPRAVNDRELHRSRKEDFRDREKKYLHQKTYIGADGICFKT